MPRMIRKVVRWGHNTAILIPKTILHELRLEPGDHVVLYIVDGALVVRELEDDIWRRRVARDRALQQEDQPVSQS